MTVGDLLEQSKKFHPLTFKGTTDPMEAEGWIARIEKIFEVRGCIDEHKVSFATFMLEGDSNHQCKTTKRALDVDNELISWQKFLDAFYDKVLP